MGSKFSWGTLFFISLAFFKVDSAIRVLLVFLHLPGGGNSTWKEGRGRGRVERELRAGGVLRLALSWIVCVSFHPSSFCDPS